MNIEQQLEAQGWKKWEAKKNVRYYMPEETKHKAIGLKLQMEGRYVGKAWLHGREISGYEGYQIKSQCWNTKCWYNPSAREFGASGEYEEELKNYCDETFEVEPISADLDEDEWLEDLRNVAAPEWLRSLGFNF